jgi:Gas vesicle protein G
MGVLTLLFRLPFLPAQGVVRIGEIVRDQAEREHHDPAAIRRQLEEAETARVYGEASDEDVARTQEEAVRRLVTTARNEPGRPAGSEPRRPAGSEPRRPAGSEPGQTARYRNRS